MITHNIPFENKTTLLNHLQYNYVWSYENNFWGLKLGTKEGGRMISLPTECNLLISFANSLIRENVGPGRDQNCLTL